MSRSSVCHTCEDQVENTTTATYRATCGIRYAVVELSIKQRHLPICHVDLTFPVPPQLVILVKVSISEKKIEVWRACAQASRKSESTYRKIADAVTSASNSSSASEATAERSTTSECVLTIAERYRKTAEYFEAAVALNETSL